MGPIVFWVLGLIGEAFMLYVLMQWFREGRRKGKAQVHRKRGYLVSSRLKTESQQFRDFEAKIHRKIARYTVFSQREFGKK